MPHHIPKMRMGKKIFTCKLYVHCGWGGGGWGGWGVGGGGVNKQNAHAQFFFYHFETAPMKCYILPMRGTDFPPSNNGTSLSQEAYSSCNEVSEMKTTTNIVKMGGKVEILRFISDAQSNILSFTFFCPTIFLKYSKSTGIYIIITVRFSGGWMATSWCNIKRFSSKCFGSIPRKCSSFLLIINDNDVYFYSAWLINMWFH